jgi:Cu+-exporting ATPase
LGGHVYFETSTVIITLIKMGKLLKARSKGRTGTITEGKPVVTTLVPDTGGGVTETELLTLAASVEKGSQHPLGRAVVNEAQAQGLTLTPVEAFMAYGGDGAGARLDGRTARVGKPKWFDDRSGWIAAEMAGWVSDFQTHGKTVMVAAENDRLLGLIGVADHMKADSPAAIASLKRQRLETVMLTGENRQAPSLCHLAFDMLNISSANAL